MIDMMKSRICEMLGIQYPVIQGLSVNLNKPDYFVCYNSTYFNNTVYHPAPGNLGSRS